MKRPLVAATSAYAAGVLLAQIFHPPLMALGASACGVLVAALSFRRCRGRLIWPLLTIAGWTNLMLHTAVISPNDLRTVLGSADAIVTVRGTLTETPHLKIAERDGEQTEHTLAQVRVSELRGGDTWQPAKGKIIVTTPSALPEQYFSGQSVEIAGVISRPPPPLAEGLFDYRDHLQTRGIYYQLKTSGSDDWSPGAAPVKNPPLTDRFLNWAKRTLATGMPAEDEPLRLLWAMTLGWRTAFTGDISEPFLQAGTMHMFAIDGLRIALISGMIVALLRGLQLARAGCGLIAVPLIWFYTAATGWESPAIRASVMMTIVIGGWALQRPTDLINSLAAAALLILAWDPRQLFEAGFQLSFFVVLIIGLLTPPLNQSCDQLLRHDPMLPDERLPRWRRTLIAFFRMLARYGTVSFAAWIGSIPLSALYFHLFSPISTPANLVAVPLGTLALMSNLGALVCGAWFPWATEMFNHSAWFFMVAMTKASVLATQIPGAYCYVPAPTWWMIAIFYTVLVGGLGGWLFAPPRRILSAAMLIFLGAIYFGQWEKSRSEIGLTILPLNGRHAVYADADGRKNDWLVNCGNEHAVELTLKPFLRAQGANTLPRLALTEGDAQNSGGVQALRKHFEIGELVTSPVHFRSAAYRKAVAQFDLTPARHRVLQSGDTAGYWRVLHPAATNQAARADDNALVLLGNWQGTKILLLSDLGREGQSALLEHTNKLHADIVVAGLPRQGEPLCDALLRAIQPKVIVVADSAFPANRRASGSLETRLEQTQIPVVYTRISGAVKIVADRGGWKLRAMDGQTFNSAAESD